MLITVRGRVAMDPTAVPQAASMQAGRDDSFAQVLQQTVDGEAPPRIDQRNPEQVPADEPTPAEGEGELDGELPVDEAPTPASDTHAASNDAPLQSQTNAPAEADVTAAIRRGEPERQATAGKGADSPRTSKPPMEPLFAAIVQHHAAASGPTPAAAGPRGVTAIAATSGASAATRGTELLATRHAPLRAPATTAALRTTPPATAELFEQARDSVFKQILMKLNGDGGEMRLRLQPPELGELDLRLVVEDGNRLTLTIAADRQDVTQLLQRHLDELKQTLQQAGLEIGGASVQTRSEFAREHGGGSGREADAGAFAGSGDDERPSTDDRGRGNYLSATGLDFWA